MQLSNYRNDPLRICTSIKAQCVFPVQLKEQSAELLRMNSEAEEEMVELPDFDAEYAAAFELKPCFPINSFLDGGMHTCT